jgi:hypothetical protein
MMELPAEVIEDVRRRLRRAAGQVQAVERMLAEGRECRDVVGFKIVASGLAYCIEHPEEAKASGYPLETVERMFLTLT